MARRQRYRVVETRGFSPGKGTHGERSSFAVLDSAYMWREMFRADVGDVGYRSDDKRRRAAYDCAARLNRAEREWERQVG
jgi:hypothetical protein